MSSVQEVFLGKKGGHGLKIENFEDIKAWQKAREFVKEIYMLTNKGNFSKDFGLKEQVRRASVSIMANVAEGFDSQSDQEFIKYLGYSRRSATEVLSHLYVAFDQKYILEQKFEDLKTEITLIKQLIGGFIRYLKKE
jgi:four helix bundle protein